MEWPSFPSCLATTSLGFDLVLFPRVSVAWADSLGKRPGVEAWACGAASGWGIPLPPEGRAASWGRRQRGAWSSTHTG